MSFIHFEESNCKNCYRCIRGCPVKAIEFKNNQARIIDESCIYCCNCLKECPQNAKTVDTHLAKVRMMLRSGDTVIASLAPSFAAYFEDPDELKERLYALGFAEIRETAEAAEWVSRAYHEEYAIKGSLMTTACPVVVEHVQKYYPHLISSMAAVDSPMIAHAKWIKQQRPRAKVVFIGPCYAKKQELVEQPGWVDALLTFDGIEMLGRYHAELSAARELVGSHPAEPLPELVARLYPIEGGVISTTFKNGSGSLRHRTISGIENCRRLFESLKEPPQGYFIELNACEGGCINGPVSGNRYTMLEKQDRIEAYSRTRPVQAAENPPALEALVRPFRDKSLAPSPHTEADIRAVLAKIGKAGRDDEWNCGACGYSSCRDKAKAVLDGKAELYMCMPYMQARAESFAHVVLERTPNAVIAVTDQLLVKEANDAAAAFFQLSLKHLLGLPLEFLIDLGDMPLSETEPIRRKAFFPDLRKTAIITASFVPEHQLYLVILHDLTEREQEQERLKALKQETVEMAQKVIENQMRVAQEIASLLGETTAETKVTLTKLKQLLLQE